MGFRGAGLSAACVAICVQLFLLLSSVTTPICGRGWFFFSLLVTNTLAIRTGRRIEQPVLFQALGQPLHAAWRSCIGDGRLPITADHC